MSVLLLATRNPGKLREIARMLEGKGIALETLADHPEVGEIEETGVTFEENARLKAAFAARATGRWSLGDDSGIAVDALGGAPGVRSARYAGGHGDDEANNRKLVRDLEGAGDRSAHYEIVFALAAPDGSVAAVARGRWDGRIGKEPRGTGGFGYDPWFVPDGETRTAAELSADEKDAVSHRGKGLRALLPEVERHLGAR